MYQLLSSAFWWAFVEIYHGCDQVNNIPTMQLFTGISRNTQSKSHMLLLTECVCHFQNSVFWDTLYHAYFLSAVALFGDGWGMDAYKVVPSYSSLRLPSLFYRMLQFCRHSLLLSLYSNCNCRNGSVQCETVTVEMGVFSVKSSSQCPALFTIKETAFRTITGIAIAQFLYWEYP